MNSKLVIALLVVGVSLLYIPYQLHDHLAGDRPTKQYDDYLKEKNRAENFDPKLNDLYKRAEAEPKNINNWKELANAISQKLNESPTASQGLVFELIDALQHVLDLNPDDTDALLSMGNVSYNFQVFDRAAHYFSKYLEKNKSDLSTRATYASALSFGGRFDDAEKELIFVITKSPKAFLPRANLAINYALSGNKVEAEKASVEAVKFAPDKESKDKFQSFLHDILNPPANIQTTTTPPAPTADPQLNGIAKFVKANPVAGDKFVTVKLEGTTMELHFANFPMKQMPPFAREKFLSGIKEEVSKNSLDQKLNSVVFIDHATNEVMDTMTLSKD